MKHPQISTLFFWCNDIAATRHFYAELIGFEETYFDEPAGWFTCQSGELNLVFMRASSTLPTISEWAQQPGYRGGTLEAPSWVISVPASEFQNTVNRLKNGGAPCLQDDSTSPQPGHLQFYVMDPMGNTIEIFSEPD